METGVPQGSVLGPTLWNIVYDGVLRIPLFGKATTIAYVDDLALIVTARDIEELTAVTNVNVAKIHNWLRNIELDLAVNKTEAILLKGHRLDLSNIDIRLQNVRIRICKEVKYLGVTIGEGCTLGKHISHTCEKADAVANRIARILPNIPGPKCDKRRAIASAHNSILMYAASMWAPVVTDIKRYRNKMESSQRKVLLRVASAYRTVSTKFIPVYTLPSTGPGEEAQIHQ